MVPRAVWDRQDSGSPTSGTRRRQRPLGKLADLLARDGRRQLRETEQWIHHAPLFDLTYGPRRDQHVPEAKVGGRSATRAGVVLHELVGRIEPEQDAEIAPTRRHVLGRVAEPGLLPVDNADKALANPQQVAWPVVAMQQGSLATGG